MFGRLVLFHPKIAARHRPSFSQSRGARTFLSKSGFNRHGATFTFSFSGAGKYCAWNSVCRSTSAIVDRSWCTP